MNVQTTDIRELSSQECESASGGVGLLAAVLVGIGAIAAGSLLAYCVTEKEEEVLVPDIQFPS
jgi:hypothetical protein